MTERSKQREEKIIKSANLLNRTFSKFSIPSILVLAVQGHGGPGAYFSSFHFYPLRVSQPPVIGQKYGTIHKLFSHSKWNEPCFVLNRSETASLPRYPRAALTFFKVHLDQPIRKSKGGYRWIVWKIHHMGPHFPAQHSKIILLVSNPFRGGAFSQSLPAKHYAIINGLYRRQEEGASGPLKAQQQQPPSFPESICVHACVVTVQAHTSR